MKAGRLLVRADASPAIGTGHVMRCLALAQAWRDLGGTIRFALAESTPAVLERIRSDGAGAVAASCPPGSSEDAAWTLGLAGEWGADWLVADGYCFRDAFQKVVASAGQRLLLIDDGVHSSSYAADVVLNQNVDADPEMYQAIAPDSLLLTGSQYVLMRKEFLPWRERRPEPRQRGGSLLVTMGGADPEKLTMTIVEALAGLALPDLRVDVIVGGSNPNVGIIRQQLSGFGEGFRCLEDVRNMPEIMVGADLAITAAGSTCWELAYLGVPFVTVIAAENQAPIAQALHNRGVAELLGNRAHLDPQRIRKGVAELLENRGRRRSGAEAGMALVDGRGAERVVGILLEKT